MLACPAPAQAAILRGLDPELAGALDSIPYAPVAVVFTAWDEGTWPRRPEGFGALVARGEDVGVLGTIFTSNIFPGQAQPDELLLRTFVGGAVEPKALDDDDEAILARVYQAHARFFGPPRHQPRMACVIRHPRGIPQYLRGHMGVVRAARAASARHPGLFLAGNHLEGIGVKDCARNAETLADQLIARLALGASAVRGS